MHRYIYHSSELRSFIDCYDYGHEEACLVNITRLIVDSFPGGEGGYVDNIHVTFSEADAAIITALISKCRFITMSRAYMFTDMLLLWNALSSMDVQWPSRIGQFFKTIEGSLTWASYKASDADLIYEKAIKDVHDELDKYRNESLNAEMKIKCAIDKNDMEIYKIKRDNAKAIKELEERVRSRDVRISVLQTEVKNLERLRESDVRYHYAYVADHE